MKLQSKNTLTNLIGFISFLLKLYLESKKLKKIKRNIMKLINIMAFVNFIEVVHFSKNNL